MRGIPPTLQVESSPDSEYVVTASTIEFAFEIVSAALLYQELDHGDQSSAVQKAAASDNEQGFHPRSRYRRSRPRPLGRSHTLPLFAPGTCVAERAKAAG